MAAPPPDPAQQLRQRVAEDARALAGQVLREQAAPPEAALQQLAAMQRLAELAAATPRPRRAWAPAVLLVLTLGLLSVLLFARLGETEVHLAVVVDGASFTLATRQPLTETLVLQTLGASGLRGWRTESAPAAAASAPAVRAVASTPGTVTLASLPGASGMRVQLRPAPNGLQLSLQGAGTVQASLLGRVSLESPGLAPLDSDGGVPTELRLDAGPDLDLDIQFTSTPPLQLFALPLAVSALGLERLEAARQGGDDLVRRLSTLRSGTVRLPALGDAQRTLARGELLRLDLVDARVVQIDREGPHLALSLQGRARDIVAGTERHPRRLMPTWLEWLAAQHGLSLLWGSALYLFGLAMAVWRWWSRPT
ncbi:hypothetical protein ACPOLB_26910 [Rubrivivax sp. RP6-9]|uniref:hypothetical protein n=1 Tax=Rubrivivax sp. RP6-9 TaxID=3415750 RepID=UPI003CC6A28C